MFRLIATLVLVLLSAAPVTAQMAPKAEMLEEVHPAVYEAGVTAELTAQKADERFESDLVAYEIAAANLRRAIRMETDFAKFAAVFAEYRLRSVQASWNTASLVYANSQVAKAYNENFLEMDQAKMLRFNEWLHLAWIHEKKFPADAGEDPELSSRALQKYLELQGKLKK